MLNGDPQPINDSPLPFPPTAKERARIHRLLQRIRPTMLRKIDVTATLPLKLNRENFDALFFHLGSLEDVQWKQRLVSAWILGVAQIPTDERDIVIFRLSNILSPRRHYTSAQNMKRLMVMTSRLFRVVFVLLLLASSLWASQFWIDWLLTIFLILLTNSVAASIFTFLILPFAMLRATHYNNSARVAAATALLRQNALEALPELLEGACDKSLEVSKKCRVALTDFLPQITEENRDFMPLNSEELLGKILEDVPDLVLGEATLDYLEKFGQGRNCAAVEFYVKCLMHKATVLAFNEVYDKGQRVFVVLQERRGRNRDGEHLLRHSIAPNAQPDELLRPAADSQTTPSEQLLRASTTGIIDT